MVGLLLLRIVIFITVLLLLWSFGFFRILHSLAKKTNVFNKQYKDLEEQFNKSDE